MTSFVESNVGLLYTKAIKSKKDAKINELFQEETKPADLKLEQLSIEGATGWCSVILIIMVVLAFFPYLLASNKGGAGLISILFIGIWVAEFGMVFFMLHLLFLFTSTQPARVLPGIAAVFIVGAQIAFATQGFGLVPLIAAVMAITILGWFCQRITGISLSFRGSPVYQAPLGTRFFLMLPAVLIFLGLIPFATTFMFSGASGRTEFMTSSTIIYFSLWTLAVCSVPFFLLYIAFWYIKARKETKIALGMIVSVSFIVSVLFATAQPWMVGFVPWLIGWCSLFWIGIFLAYWPFHRFGYRIVRARRSIVTDRQLNVSFDEVQ